MSLKFVVAPLNQISVSNSSQVYVYVLKIKSFQCGFMYSHLHTKSSLNLLWLVWLLLLPLLQLQLPIETGIRCLAEDKAHVNSVVPWPPFSAVRSRISGRMNIYSVRYSINLQCACYRTTATGPFYIVCTTVSGCVAVALRSCSSIFDLMSKIARHGTVHLCLVFTKAPDVMTKVVVLEDEFIHCRASFPCTNSNGFWSSSVDVDATILSLTAIFNRACTLTRPFAGRQRKPAFLSVQLCLGSFLSRQARQAVAGQGHVLLATRLDRNLATIDWEALSIAILRRRFKTDDKNMAASTPFRPRPWPPHWRRRPRRGSRSRHLRLTPTTGLARGASRRFLSIAEKRPPGSNEETRPGLFRDDRPAGRRRRGHHDRGEDRLRSRAWKKTKGKGERWVNWQRRDYY
jgi:hypothetical protein